MAVIRDIYSAIKAFIREIWGNSQGFRGRNDIRVKTDCLGTAYLSLKRLETVFTGRQSQAAHCVPVQGVTHFIL